MRILKVLPRVIIGLVFLFSGFVKLIDPVGIGLIFEEYLKIVGLGAFHTLALIMGVSLAIIEMLLGLTLLIQLRVRYSAIAALAFLSFFTLLTFFLAIFNPITDCGCFGEAIKLSNWQTFFKNIFLLALAVILFLQRRKIGSQADAATEWGVIALLATILLFFSIHSYRYLPMIDFMEYKPGTNLRVNVNYNERGDSPLFETLLIYSKEGKRYEFTVDNLPDSTYTFVDSKTKKVSKNDAIADFAISDNQGNYVTNSILSSNRKLFLISVPFPKHLKRGYAERFIKLKDAVEGSGGSLIILSGAGYYSNELLEVSEKIPVYYTDFKTLLTFNRSNGGAVYLHDGVIVSKWAYRKLPVKSVAGIMKNDSELISLTKRVWERLSIEFSIISLVIIIFLIRFVLKVTRRKTENI